MTSANRVSGSAKRGRQACVIGHPDQVTKKASIQRCGEDHYNHGKCDHRKQWLEERLKTVGQLFSCGIYSLAMMRNHFHIAPHISPKQANDWSFEVATRWIHSSPGVLSRQYDQTSPDAFSTAWALVRQLSCGLYAWG